MIQLSLCSLYVYFVYIGVNWLSKSELSGESNTVDIQGGTLWPNFAPFSCLDKETLAFLKDEPEAINSDDRELKGIIIFMDIFFS